MPFVLPAYDLAYREFLADAVDGFIAADHVLGQIAIIRDPHAGPIRNVRTETPLDQSMVQMSASMTLSRDALRLTDIDAYTAMIASFAKEMIAEQTKHFFKAMAEMCVAAGTSVENVGAGVPTIEQIRQMLRTMDLTFDEDGKWHGLQLYADPSQMGRANELIQQFENDPECQRIVLEKRAQWLSERAEKSRRALSR